MSHSWAPLASAVIVRGLPGNSLLFFIGYCLASPLLIF
jgi:hypothetical protein